MVDGLFPFGMSSRLSHICRPTYSFQACILVVRLDQCPDHQRLHDHHSRCVYTRQLVEHRLSIRRLVFIRSCIASMGLHDLDVGKIPVVCVRDRSRLTSVSVFLNQQSYH